MRRRVGNDMRSYGERAKMKCKQTRKLKKIKVMNKNYLAPWNWGNSRIIRRVVIVVTTKQRYLNCTNTVFAQMEISGWNPRVRRFTPFEFQISNWRMLQVDGSRIFHFWDLGYSYPGYFRLRKHSIIYYKVKVSK